MGDSKMKSSSLSSPPRACGCWWCRGTLLESKLLRCRSPIHFRVWRIIVCWQNKNVLYLSQGIFIASDDGRSLSPLMVLRLKYFSMQPNLFTSKLIVKNVMVTNLWTDLTLVNLPFDESSPGWEDIIPEKRCCKQSIRFPDEKKR